jgi:hypothetical protein
MEKIGRRIQQAAEQWNGDIALSTENNRRYQEF